MDNRIAPFVPGTKVQAKSGVSFRVGEFTVKEMHLTSQGWSVVLEEFSIGYHGRLPAGEFTEVRKLVA